MRYNKTSMTINYDFLTAPINPAKLKEFSKQPKVPKVIHYYGLIGAILAAFFGLWVAVSVVGGFRVVFNLDTMLMLGTMLIIVAGIVTAGYYLGRFFSKRALEHLYRLTNFAQANGWTYTARLSDPSHAGMIFGNGHSRYALDQIASTSGNAFEIANYYYTTGSGKNSQTHSWGYVCIKLKRRVPNMVLDSKANNSNLLGFNMSNLPASLRGNATMSLEGDFDKYFTLYAPKEYERDALYVFTPELMALLIDESAKFDVEVVDDRMYVYSSAPFDMMKAVVLQTIFKIINQVGEEMIDNTDYYADERVGNRQANIVAAQGARLKHGVPVFVIVIFIIVILFQILPLFLN